MDGFAVTEPDAGSDIIATKSTAVYDSQGKVIPDKRGEDAIRDFMEKTNIPVYSVAGIREVVDYLYQEKTSVLINGRRRPIDGETKALFDE